MVSPVPLSGNRNRIRLLLILAVGVTLLTPRPSAARSEAARASATKNAHAATAEPRVELPGHVLPGLGSALRIADRSTATEPPLTLTFVLARDDQPGFERYLRDVYDPASPRHRRFLTPAQLAARFGPSRAAYDRLSRHLRRHGFELVDGSHNRLTLTVRGPRAAVEHTLAVGIGEYELDGRRFHANDREPSLPVTLATHVQAIAGLNDLAKPEGVRQAVAEVAAIVICTIPFTVGYYVYGTEGFGNEVFPPYFKALGKCIYAVKYALAYGKNPGKIDPPPPTWKDIDGREQKIGILAFDTFDRDDVADGLALAGAPPSQLDKLTEVKVNGGAAPGADQDEVLLDIATVMSIAPGADVTVYSAPFAGPGVSFQALFNAAIDGGSTIITNSWAYCENQTTAADVQSIDAILAEAAAAGISVLSAAGDTGSTCLNGSPNTVAVPASSPHLTAVGGSSLTTGPDFSWASETWWDGTHDTPPTGQGGFGTSRFFPRPAYQDGLVTSSLRSIPDVVSNADPAKGLALCQASAGGCPSGLLYGGTSMSAPSWAGFTALLNQARGQNLGALNPALYPLAAAPGAFHTAADLGSDVAHVGLGSPRLDALHSLLSNQPPSAVSASESHVLAVADATGTFVADGRNAGAPADGVTALTVTVRLIDGNGIYLHGKTVTLAAAGGSAVITPPSVVVPAESRTAVFRITDLVAESVELTATDVTDGVVLTEKANVTFVPPPAVNAGIQAFPATAPANGVGSTSITVTLTDGLGRPSPGKLIRLAQGSAHSLISGPVPSVTGADGQIVFTAVNRVNETVTYTAVDVTDGDLPIPGSAQVTFTGASTSCVNPNPPVGQNGYAVTPFATGFFAENFNFAGVNWGGCPGASFPAFRGDDVFIAGFRNGEVYRFGLDGGAVSSANLLATVGQTLAFPVVGTDGRVYATRGATGAPASGTVVELDPATGAILRTLASGLKCPAGLAVDPLSGDLFFTHQCFGGGQDDAALHRIRDPESATPALEVYATLPGTPNGMVAFAPNGTIYVAASYTTAPPPVVRVSGTDVAGPPTMTPIADVTSIFTMTIGAVDDAGEATSLLGLTVNGLELFDLTAAPPTRTLIATNTGGGVIGPDGCVYANVSDTVYKIARDDGSCDFAPTGARPALTLTPATTVPNPDQGTAKTFTATFRNVTVSADTPVFFRVTGANPQVRMVRTDATGAASFTYTSLEIGADTIVATATLGDDDFLSNRALVTWGAGRHTTFLALNGSALGGKPGTPAPLTAALSDVSLSPPAPIVGATVAFTVAGQQCQGVTDANGTATCTVTLPQAGATSLTAAFAGTPQLLPASATTGFDVAGTISLGSFTAYQATPTKNAPKLPKLGPVVLGDQAFGDTADYDVVKSTLLAAPADTNGAGVDDHATHLVGYAVKRAKSSAKFQQRKDLQLVNACGALVLTATKPDQLLVPAAADPTTAVTVPEESAHEVDHLLCYQVKVQKKRTDGTPAAAFPKGVQVTVVDELQNGAAARRYDLKKPRWLCNPVSKSGTPKVLAGPAKGTSFPLTAATLRHPASKLVCYTAALAKKVIPQAGCGQVAPGAKGIRLVPTQAKHAKRVAVRIATQLLTSQMDTKKEALICVPSTVLP